MTLVDGAPADGLPADDRGLAYGDGLFETIAVRDGRCLAWSAHIERLQTGCVRLGFAAPAPAALAADAASAIGDAVHGVLKIIVTRGSGGRGYRSAPDARARRIVSLHPWPDELAPGAADAGVRTWICGQRLSSQAATAGLKHLNRLDQVLASRDWPDATCFEGLMLDQAGRLVEGTCSNLFVVENGVVATPALTLCGVRGIVRAAVMRWCEGAGLVLRESALWPARLAAADEVFLCNSIIGVRAVASVRELPDLRLSPGPVTAAVRAALRAAAVIA